MVKMVRSSGHHRKRSRSRSVTPDHKRSKSSRDYDKDRSRRRSRSRDRLRRSRSRDRKKDKKVSESRVRSKPLRLKRHSRSRSRSRSRSKSKEKSTKKDEKKEVKADDEPFDPTNLDKEDGGEWVVTDVIEETAIEDNGTLEEEFDYEIDEDDQYSHASSASHQDFNQSSHEQQLEEPETKNNSDDNEVKNENNEEVDGDKLSADQENSRDNIPSEIFEEAVLIDDAPAEEENVKDVVSVLTDETPAEKESVKEVVSVLTDETPAEKESVKEMVSKIKESSSHHKQRVKFASAKHEAERNYIRRSDSYRRSHSRSHMSEEIERLSKDQIRQWIKLDKELYDLRMRHEVARHKRELELIQTQLDYWKNKSKLNDEPK